MGGNTDVVVTCSPWTVVLAPLHIIIPISLLGDMDRRVLTRVFVEHWGAVYTTGAHRLTHDLYSKPRSSRHDSSSASPNNDTLDFKSYGQTSQPVYAMCPGFLMIPDATGK